MKGGVKVPKREEGYEKQDASVYFKCTILEKAMFQALARELGYKSVSEMIRRELIYNKEVIKRTEKED